jgi:hypothetical protein
VLIDGGASINVMFPKVLQALGIPLSSLQESNSPFFGIVPGEGEHSLEHIYLPVTFGTPDNFRTETLCFVVANFKCTSNAIIGRSGLAKFMAVLHYSYLVLKMIAPAGVLTVRADF